MRKSFYQQRGFALLLVLILVTFAAAIALLFLLSAQRERTGTDSFAQGSRVRQLADTAVNLVMAQINTATKQGTAAKPISWASQPGMIRTYDTTGGLHNAFKLYSWTNLVEGNTFNPTDSATQLPPANWSALPGLYTDLNQPVNQVYPIVDPAAQTQVENFSIVSSNVAVSGQTSSTPNPAPMPVQWLYVLEDGSWVTPTSTTGTALTIPGATASNPIVGRIAFWTDDETCKVNINTASEGAYWDWPKAATADELQFAGNPPVKNEFNRVPGHPAMTSLSAVFPEMRENTFNRWNNVNTFATQLQDIFGIVPRLDWSLGGSRGGTYPITSYTASYAPTYDSWISPSTYGPLTLDANRLYATSDDLWFKPNRTANGFSTYNITPQQLAQRLFFLSSKSSAPETTLFETPRISLWPITYPYLSSFWNNFSANCTIAAFSGRRSTTKPTSFPSPDSTANPLVTLAASNPPGGVTVGGYTYVNKYITPQEQLIGYCSTLDTANTSLVTPNAYYFQRQNPDSPTSDWANITRNRSLTNYLRSELAQPFPGMGATAAASNLSTKWDSWTAGNTDWIALNCFDFSRSLINQATFDPAVSNNKGNLLYAYSGVSGRQTSIGGIAMTTTAGSYAEPNAAAVVPLHVTPTTSAFTSGKTYVTQGAYPTLKEAAIMFYATSRVEPLPPTTGSGAVDGNKVTYASEWQNLITYSPPVAPAVLGTGKSRTKSMRAVMFFSFSQMNPGAPMFYPVFWIKVKPVANGTFGVVCGSQSTGNIGLATTGHNSIQWNCFANGWTTSPTFGPYFYKQYNQPKIFSNAPSTTPSSPGTLANSSPAYYTLISDSIPTDPNELYFTFSGTNVQVDLYAPYSSNLDIDPTADPAQLISSQQIDFSSWNSTLPLPLAPRWNACQAPMTLAGTTPTRTLASGVPMPDPTSANPGPSGAPPAGWQAEVVPQLWSFLNISTGLLSVDNLSLEWPAYKNPSTGAGAANSSPSGTGGGIPYVYTGTITSPTGATAPALNYASTPDGQVGPLTSATAPNTLGANYISTDIRCRVTGLAQRGLLTTANFQYRTEGGGQDPFNVNINYNNVQGYTLITPYDTVISMVSNPASGTGKAAGDPRLMGRGIYNAAGSSSFIPIKNALTGASPNHVIGINPNNTIVTSNTVNSSKFSVFPPRSTDQSQYHQLGWPGPSGWTGSGGPSMPMNTGYLTVPTFGGGTNYMAIRGIGSALNSIVLGSLDSPTAAVSVEGNVSMSLDPNGDWTSMPGASFDGGYIGRPDQDYQSLAQDASSTFSQYVPYFNMRYGNYSYSTTSTGSTESTSSTLFMPNRQVPSPLILGTLPSDMKTGWKTLAFSPNPAASMNSSSPAPHPGVGTLKTPSATGAPYTSVPDHLLLDLFWMPVAEPYPISSQFATAGKVNLNYAMMPFPYILRKTALTAILKPVWLYALPFSGTAGTSTAAYYKSFSSMSNVYPGQHSRYPIAVNETLKAFDYKFNNGDIFRSASQICDMFLYPNDPTKSTDKYPLASWDSANANITGWWNGQQLTSDNGREEPYNAIYSRVTTKSNTYTVHWRVQALRKTTGPGSDPSMWTEGTDHVTSELRGSTLIERYLDPNATDIPDYANSATASTALPLSNYYKWRVDSETYFQPSP